MTAPVVMWDIDDVLHPFSQLAHEACVRAGIVPDGMENPWVWAPFEIYGCTDQQWFDALAAATMERQLHWSHPSFAVLDAFVRLDKIGAEQHFITARGFMDNPQEIRNITIEWVDHFFGGFYKTLTFTKDKGAKALELGVTHAIDDHLQNYADLVQVGVETYLMDMPWNQNAVGVRRVKSVTEFVDAIEKGLPA